MARSNRFTERCLLSKFFRVELNRKMDGYYFLFEMHALYHCIKGLEGMMRDILNALFDDGVAVDVVDSLNEEIEVLESGQEGFHCCTV